MSIRESEYDRSVESYIKHLYEEKYGYTLEPTKTLFLYDFHAYKNDKLIGIVEVRRRHCDFEQYPDYWISNEKYRKIRLAAEAFEVPAIFVFVFNDGVYHIDLTNYPRLPSTYGYRGNQEIPRYTDNEKVVCISKDKLIRIFKKQ